tara:strand:+ start:568 stop:1650 length:1083 start_codon:yes stop_codon:yes gene_type:complete
MSSDSTLQGKKYKYNKFKFLKSFTSKIFEPNIFKNKEGFKEGNSIKENIKKTNEKMKKLEMEFNGKLQEYNILYEQYIKEKMVHDTDISHIKGKSVKWEGKNYFISNDGVMREIKWGWKADKHQCPEPNINLTQKQRDKLVVGESLKKTMRGGVTFYEKCINPWINSGNKVIANDITNDVAWLDDLGIKHKFKHLGAKHISCPQKVDTTINDIEFSIITNGNELSPTDPCIRHTDSKKKRLDTVNNELKAIAVKMKDEINKVSDQRRELEGGKQGFKLIKEGFKEGATSTITSNSIKIDKIIKSLDEKRKHIQILENEIYSLDGNIRDNKYLVDSTNYKYIAWGVSFISLLGLGLYTIKK